MFTGAKSIENDAHEPCTLTSAQNRYMSILYGKGALSNSRSPGLQLHDEVSLIYETAFLKIKKNNGIVQVHHVILQNDLSTLKVASS